MQQGEGRYRTNSESLRSELPGAFLVFIAHDDIFLINIKWRTQAARAGIKVNGVPRNVNQRSFQNLLHLDYSCHIMALGLYLFHFSPNDWMKDNKADVLINMMHNRCHIQNRQIGFLLVNSVRDAQ